MSDSIVPTFNLTKLVPLIGDRKHFPNISGFALVSGFVRQKRNEGYSIVVYHGALKLHGHTKRRRLRDRITHVLNAEFDASHQVEVRGISGWDRLCKRIFAESFRYWLNRSNLDADAFKADEEEYKALKEQFEKHPLRQRRRLETYMDMKRGARRKSRQRRVLRPRGYRLAGRRITSFSKPVVRKPPGDKPP